MLQKGAPAWESLDHATHAQAQPVWIGELWADTLVIGADEQVEERSEEAPGEGGGGVRGTK